MPKRKRKIFDVESKTPIKQKKTNLEDEEPKCSSNNLFSGKDSKTSSKENPKTDKDNDQMENQVTVNCLESDASSINRLDKHVLPITSKDDNSAFCNKDIAIVSEHDYTQSEDKDIQCDNIVNYDMVSVEKTIECKESMKKLRTGTILLKHKGKTKSRTKQSAAAKKKKDKERKRHERSMAQQNVVQIAANIEQSETQQNEDQMSDKIDDYYRSKYCDERIKESARIMAALGYGGGMATSENIDCCEESDMQTKLREKRNKAYREKYRTDLSFRERKKECSRNTYAANTTYSEKKKKEQKNNYNCNEDPGYRQLKRTASSQKYKQNLRHEQSMTQQNEDQMSANIDDYYRSKYSDERIKESARIMSALGYGGGMAEHVDCCEESDMQAKLREKRNKEHREKYHTDLSFRERKKECSRNRYAANTRYREKKKKEQRNKYNCDEDPGYRQLKRTASSQKYKQNLRHRLHVISSGIQKYRNNDLYKVWLKNTSIKKYRENIHHRECVKGASIQKYKDNLCHRERVKSASIHKYKHNFYHKERVKSAGIHKYKNNLCHRERVKSASIQKYKDNLCHKERVKSASIQKYKDNLCHKERVKSASIQKYKDNLCHKERVKSASIQKYKDNLCHKERVKSASIQKYKDNLCHKERLKSASTLKYSHNKQFREEKKHRSVQKYRHSATFRQDLKIRLKDQYKQNAAIKVRKTQMVLKRRKEKKKKTSNLALFFREHVKDGPTFVCCVCNKFKFKKQVVVCETDKYMKNGQKAYLNAKHCITYRYAYKCNDDCEENCEILNHNKIWICYTCHRHLLKGQIPADASANNLQLKEIPEELKHLNSLERQLLSLRIPFMKIVSLPKGGQRGVAGPCVSVPTDIQKTTSALPRCQDDNDLIRVKLKRKLLYKGHHQYQYICPSKLQKGLQYLQQHNPWYKDTNFNKEWQNPVQSALTVDNEEDEFDNQEISSTTAEQNTTGQQEEVKGTNSDIDDDEETIRNKGLPLDTCLQPTDIGQEILDQHFDGIFCIAPSEGKTPVSMLREKGNEAMSFPMQFPDSDNTYDSERAVKLTHSRYFHSRLQNADNRFAKDTQYIFYAQYLSELEQVVSQVSVALRKGTTDITTNNNITADMVKDPSKLKNLLKTDQGYKFLTPIRGTPPYWETTLKDLFAMIRQLGIPTWFCTFSAADMRWSEVIQILLEQQANGSQLSVENLEWLDKCEVLRENPIMNAVIFDHRFHTLLKNIIIDHNVIGKVKDYFYRVEFQQRGSPHTHCLFWIDDAPLVDRDDDDTVCSFINEYVSCKLPSQEEDAELHEIVSSVQQHSKNHSKSCRKKGKGSTCRFHFPRPPSEKTFVSRPESATDPSLEGSPQQIINQAKETLQAVWTVINTVDLLEITTANIFEAAGITQEEFERASNILTKRMSVVLERSPSDTWINQYNPTLLRCWNANMDIQYVTDAYSCVMYIISYISKAEREMGLVLEKARKEAAEGNLDAQNAMKKIGAAYFHQREVSAQEAAYRVCGLHLKECSRKVQFVPVGNDPIRMSKPLSLIQRNSDELDEDEIWMPTTMERYRARPLGKQFDSLCLASFCSQFRILASSQVPKDLSKAKNVYELQNNLGFIQKRTRTDEAVVRYVRFSPKKESELYHKSVIQLFLPHRIESQLKPDAFTTFEEFYSTGAVKLVPNTNTVSVKSIVDANKQHFEINAEALDEAQELLEKIGPLEDAWAMIAPETESDRLECQMDKERLPEEEESIEIPELDASGQHSSDDHSVEMSNYQISSQDALPLLQSMNKMQKQIFYKVRDWCLDKANGKRPKPFHLFVTGGAGTGKSHLIRCIYYEAQRLLAPSAPTPDDPVILLTAPTGTAAFNIGGTTLHQAFSLPQYLKLPYQHMKEEKLNSLRCRLQNLMILIIDEISMVGQKLLIYVHERLRQVKQTGSSLFGNVCIIAVGDFFQLPPVKQVPLYELHHKKFCSLWSLNFSIVQLKEIMRQREDAAFAELLNRIRVQPKNKSLDDADLECLQSCEGKDYEAHTLHIFGTNSEVDLHNKKMIEEVCDEYQTLTAQDFDKNVTTGTLKRKESPYTTTNDYLPSEILLARGARVMLVRNIDLSDGLVNGVVGTVSNIPHRTGSIKSDQIHVVFDNSKIGQKQRISLPPCERDKNITAINLFEENLPNSAVRYQFPLRLAWGCTVHKVQGITTDKLVVSFNKIFAPGMAYVALSRVTSLDGLVIKDFDAKKIYSTERITEAIQKMPSFLPRQVISSPVQNTTNIILHNIQGLIPHIKDVKANIDVTEADYICLTETWLERTSCNPAIEHFKFYHRTRYHSYTSTIPILKTLKSMQHGGVGIFVRDCIDFTEVFFGPYNIEAMVFEIPQLNITVVLIYRPESYTSKVFLTQLSKILLNIPQQRPVLVFGDFNQDLFKPPSSIKHFMCGHGYKQLIDKATTDGDTLIDHVYIKGNVPVQTEIIPTYYSYHNMVSVKLHK